jgi:hypothetical protein
LNLRGFLFVFRLVIEGTALDVDREKSAALLSSANEVLPWLCYEVEAYSSQIITSLFIPYPSFKKRLTIIKCKLNSAVLWSKHLAVGAKFVTAPFRSCLLKFIALLSSPRTLLVIIKVLDINTSGRTAVPNVAGFGRGSTRLFAQFDNRRSVSLLLQHSPPQLSSDCVCTTACG